jgi:hypothetical protein
MTIEQIELRKILTQMLADNGINRETIVDFVKDIIDEKVEKAISAAVHETNIDGIVNSRVRDLTTRAIQEEVAKKVRATLGSVSISLECHEKIKI